MEGMNTTLYFWWKEESIGFDVFFVFGREEKSSKIVQVESRQPESLFFFLVWTCLEPFIALTRITRQRPFKAHHLQMVSDQVDLDTREKILTSYF